MRIEIVHPQASEYLNSLARGNDPRIDGVLARLEKEAEASNFPIIGPAAGKYCYLMARMIGAENIFELGSGFGYSTIWFARALRDSGRKGMVHHTVWDEKLSAEAKSNLREAGLDGLVTFHCSEAVQALEELPGPFDLIFLDIDKEGYPKAFSVIKARLRKGGILIADNVLWHGRAFDPQNRESSTLGIREFTRLASSDPDFISTLAPIRDGLWVAWRAK